MNQLHNAVAVALGFVSANQWIFWTLGGLVVNDVVNSVRKHPVTPYTNILLAGLGFLNDLFAAHSHSDSPGTLKIPGTLSQPPAVVGAAVTPPKGYATPLGLLLVMAVCVFLASCAAMPTIETQALDCSGSSAANAGPGIVGDLVSGLLTPGADQWQPKVELALAGAGLSDGVCILGDILTDFENGTIKVDYQGGVLFVPAGYTLAASMPLSPAAAQLAIIRGEQYLNGWHAKQGGIFHRLISRKAK